jgi:hypothetical protein
MSETKPSLNIVDTFSSLPPESTTLLSDLNTRIQQHEGPWGQTRGGEADAGGVMQMPWQEQDPLISEYVQFMYENDLVVPFDWSKWDEGREWFRSQDPAKYDNLDAETALKLITAIIRSDRFNEGALVGAFESGDFPKIIGKLAALSPAAWS